MSQTAIHVEGISKLYRLGERMRYTGLRHRLEDAVRAPYRWLRPRKGAKPKKGPQEIWALRDVSFDVSVGEVVGLIGRNGAGKSTLLKILSRVAQPTEGSAEIYGRVGSLLEVGTGFHQELTGRENVFLNGAVLGMGKKEIMRKFDEIVAFAEVENFIDTPLKHYSSGMQVRLAFAVAAHIEPEILLVDEVLAVGDLAFQKKCLGKMGEVAQGGRTIIFVSHQMNQIRRLCSRTIWVDQGGIRMNGSSHEVLAAYESTTLGAEVNQDTRCGKGQTAKFQRWEIAQPRSDQPHVLTTLGPTTVNFIVQLAEPVRGAEHGVALFDAQRQLMWARAERGLHLGAGCHVFSHSFPSLPLRPGAYQWQVSLWDGRGQLDLWDCLPEMVIATEVHQHYMDEWNGILNVPSCFAHGTGEGAAVEQHSNL
jgi:ABC-type polysaccharide/polyol phosphate transport system ATPase subunit